ncbi:MAG: VWA domain-containing protein [Candidatus Binataceae bacterium]
MRLRGICGLVSIAAILACAGCAGTQRPSGGELPPAPSTPPVLNLCPMPAAPKDLAAKPGFAMLNVNVADADHQPMGGLKQADFETYAKAMAFPIAFFHHDGAAPESIALVIDTSGSMKPKLPIVRGALADFLGKLYPCDEVAVFAFSDRTYLLQPFTTDHQAAVQKLALLKANGETALYDSIAKAIDLEQTSAHYPNRVVIVITDGMDNESKMTEANLVAKSKSSALRMFLIGIGDPNPQLQGQNIAIGPLVLGAGDIERVDAKAINSLADASGGQAFIVPRLGDKDDSGAFGKALGSIGAALGQGYSLGIVLPPGTSASSVTVAVPNHPDAVVTTRVIATQSPQS